MRGNWIISKNTADRVVPWNAPLSGCWTNADVGHIFSEVEIYFTDELSVHLSVFSIHFTLPNLNIACLVVIKRVYHFITPTADPGARLCDLTNFTCISDVYGNCLMPRLFFGELERNYKELRKFFTAPFGCFMQIETHIFFKVGKFSSKIFLLFLVGQYMLL